MMSRTSKLTLGVVTALPALTLALFAVSSLVSSPEGSVAAELPAPFITFGLVVLLALDAFYLVHVVRSARLSTQRKTFWVLMLTGASVVAMPVYWYVYVWKAPDGRQAEKAHRNSLWAER